MILELAGLVVSAVIAFVAGARYGVRVERSTWVRARAIEDREKLREMLR